MGGHISIALATFFPVPERSRWNTSASFTACFACSGADVLPRMVFAPVITQWDAICTDRNTHSNIFHHQKKKTINSKIFKKLSLGKIECMYRLWTWQEALVQWLVDSQGASQVAHKLVAMAWLEAQKLVAMASLEAQKLVAGSSLEAQGSVQGRVAWLLLGSLEEMVLELELWHKQPTKNLNFQKLTYHGFVTELKPIYQTGNFYRLVIDLCRKILLNKILKKYFLDHSYTFILSSSSLDETYKWKKSINIFRLKAFSRKKVLAFVMCLTVYENKKERKKRFIPL